MDTTRELAFFTLIIWSGLHDLMEPMRPIVDRKVLEFVQSHTFHPADFTIRSDGVCRLNPEVATQVAILCARRLEDLGGAATLEGDRTRRRVQNV
jgi:CRISPR/Cas system-associated endonuclease Cas1